MCTISFSYDVFSTRFELYACFNELDSACYVLADSSIKNGRRRIGIIAQEVREAYPKAVIETQDEDRLLVPDHGALTIPPSCSGQHTALEGGTAREDDGNVDDGAGLIEPPGLPFRFFEPFFERRSTEKSVGKESHYETDNKEARKRCQLNQTTQRVEKRCL